MPMQAARVSTFSAFITIVLYCLIYIKFPTVCLITIFTMPLLLLIGSLSTFEL